MPEVNNYNYNLRELAEILIKDAGLKTGKWTVGTSINFSVGNMGPTQQEATPGVTMLIDSIGLNRVGNDIPEGGNIVDASKVK